MTFGSASLLVVDDNDDNRYAMTKRLKRDGYSQVSVAANGYEALSLLRSQPFDLVLLDVLMPGLDGCSVLEQIRSDMQLRNIPVIMVSAVDELESVARCIKLGAEDFMFKPFNATLLRARVDACLEKKRLRDIEQLHMRQLDQERRRSDDLLQIILPGTAVQELKSTGQVKPRRFNEVMILFCDLVGFTGFCDTHPPEEVVGELQKVVESFEKIALAHDLEKIKTIGDAFMATAGLLKPNSAPILAGVKCGLEMIRAAKSASPAWDLRIGLHFGPVVAGVIGRHTYMYDLWGDAVNVASRLAEGGRSGCLTMTHPTWLAVEHSCRGRMRGPVELKGKGSVSVVECYELR
jgi:adenylate cyclase